MSSGNLEGFEAYVETGKGEVARRNMKNKNFDKENVVLRERSAPKQSPHATSHSPLMQWLREPLIHFFVLGLAVFGLHAILDRKPEVVEDDPHRVVLDPNETYKTIPNFYNSMDEQRVL